MSSEATEAPTRSAPSPLGNLAFCGIAWALLVSCLALVVFGLVVGERESTYDDLRLAVARGDVDSVLVTGGTAQPFIGRTTPTVHWRDGVFRYQAPVVEQHPQRRTMTDNGVAVVDSIEDDLAERSADVAVTRRPHVYPNHHEVAGFWLPAWTQVATFAVGFAGLLLLVAGPQPRRATRWAWFWLMWMAPPVGFLAFLVLGGYLSPRLRADPGKRLTGGWALLWSLLVGSALEAIGSAVL